MGLTLLREWNTYGFTFTTGPGVTEVSLSLVNNAPGGIGNDLILDNISFQACGPEALILPETVANICEDGDPITLDATVQQIFHFSILISMPVITSIDTCLQALQPTCKMKDVE